MKKIIAVAVLLIASASSASAQEYMNLFPKGRTAYQEDFDSAAQTYQTRAQTYVDDMYTYGGERNFSNQDTSLLSHEDLAAIESAPDSILNDPRNSQLLSEDAYAEPPSSPEAAPEQ